MTKKELWLRLHQYRFEHLTPDNMWIRLKERFGDDNAPIKAFAYKISRKKGWSYTFAQKAIAEYKKFVFLGIISDFVVTPPHIIDQVWHQHILFSRAYRQFCREVIRYDFDHHPELLSLDEQTGVFTAQYHETLDLYKREFGFEPPEDIWGVPKFGEQKIAAKNYQPKKKKVEAESGDGSSGFDSIPLCQTMPVGSITSSDAFEGFGGGDFGGSGAGDSWGSDSGSSDAAGGDSSSCSSGCSGCGGGD